MKTLINWKVFFILWIAAILAVLLILPYTFELQSSALDLTKLGMPLPLLILIQTLQNAIIFAIAIFAGLFFAGRVGLGAPILDAITRGESVTDRVPAILPVSILLGILSTILLLGLEFFYFQPALAKELGNTVNALNLRTGQPAAWKGFLASFYGGIAEEIQLRLFVMSFLVWLGRFISKRSDGKPTSAVFWIANILAAVLFGLGHLPATALLIRLTPLVITRAVILNGVIGVTCGWLFWKRGLESAMVAHFSADLVLHVLLAL